MLINVDHRNQPNHVFSFLIFRRPKGLASSQELEKMRKYHGTPKRWGDLQDNLGYKRLKLKMDRIQFGTRKS